MKHKVLKMKAVFLLLGIGGLYAQQAIPASGGEGSGSGGSVSYSVGQVGYTTYNGAFGSLKGIQQSYSIEVITEIEEAIDIGWQGRLRPGKK